MRACLSDDDLIGVGVDDEIGVVRHHDDLALGLRRDEERHQFVEHGLRIEIFLGLIDDQRAIVGIVERQIEQQQHDAPRAGRELSDVDAVIGDLVTNAMWSVPKSQCAELLRPRAKFGLLRRRIWRVGSRSPRYFVMKPVMAA